MTYYTNEGENAEEKFSAEDGEISSEEEGFIKGFEDEEEAEECAECGSAMHEEIVTKIIDGEAVKFCGNACATDYEDSI